jgi:hypothetical protein
VTGTRPDEAVEGECAWREKVPKQRRKRKHHVNAMSVRWGSTGSGPNCLYTPCLTTNNALRDPRHISRRRAAAIACASMEPALVDATVYDAVPTHYVMYVSPPKNCWYVLCTPQPVLTTGGSCRLLCVSKRSGRVLLVTTLYGE